MAFERLAKDCFGRNESFTGMHNRSLVSLLTIEFHFWSQVSSSIASRVMLTIEKSREMPISLWSSGSAITWAYKVCCATFANVSSRYRLALPKRVFIGPMLCPSTVFHHGDIISECLRYTENSWGIAVGRAEEKRERLDARRMRSGW